MFAPGTAPRPPLLLLIAVAAIGPLALNIFIPSMPGMTRILGVGYGTVQLTLTLYLIGVAVAQLFIGALSDRYGRRPVLLAGMVLFVAGSGLCAVAGSIELLIIGRVIQAVGGSTGLVLSRAIARDVSDHAGATRMVAYITMAMVVAPMLGPAIAVIWGWLPAMIWVVGGAIFVGENGKIEINRNKYVSNPVDLILLDMIMPGMNGSEVFDALRELDPGVRVLLSSGYHEHELAERFSDSGLAGFLQKPYGLKTLKRKLMEALR